MSTIGVAQSVNWTSAKIPCSTNLSDLISIVALYTYDIVLALHDCWVYVHLRLEAFVPI